MLPLREEPDEQAVRPSLSHEPSVSRQRLRTSVVEGVGRFEMADTGILFLDEVGELDTSSS